MYALGPFLRKRSQIGLVTLLLHVASTQIECNSSVCCLQYSYVCHTFVGALPHIWTGDKESYLGLGDLLIQGSRMGWGLYLGLK